MFSSLNDPAVLLTVSAIMGTAILLTFGVYRAASSPVKRQSFDEALSYVMGSELDIDTALNKSEKQKKSWTDYWAELVDRSGRTVTDRHTPGRAVAGLALGAIGFAYLGLGTGLLGALVAPLVTVAGARVFFQWEAGKRVHAMEKQLPQMLSALRANLQAGSTPQQSMLAIADDLPAPLGDEIRLLKRDLHVNVALEVALKSLAERVPSREMQFLVSSVEIAVRSGADLDPQLETIQRIVAQRTRIRQKLKAAVSQVTPTKALAYVAVPGMFLMSIRDAGNRAYWFDLGGSGPLMLVVSAVLYSGAVMVIRGMVKGVENA